MLTLTLTLTQFITPQKTKNKKNKQQQQQQQKILSYSNYCERILSAPHRLFVVVVGGGGANKTAKLPTSKLLFFVLQFVSITVLYNSKSERAARK